MTPLTETDMPKYRGTISEKYPRMAFCSAVTPATPEHYKHLREAGIDTVSICLHVTGLKTYKYATIHTKLAREAGLTTHAFFVTDLLEPIDDMILFFQRFHKLGYDQTSKLTIFANGDKYVPHRERRLSKLVDLISNVHRLENIDLAFFKRDIDDGIYDLARLPQMINLTIVNCGANDSGVPVAGTWIYTNEFGGTIQTLAYDYYGYYTDHTGYQLSLIDTDYVVQPGDTWYSIARRHGMAPVELVDLNRGILTDHLLPGQVIRIA